MMYRLKNTALKPPEGVGVGSFWYQQSETGWTCDVGSLAETIEAVVKHRVVNGLARQTPSEVDEDIQDQICKRVGHEWCRNMNAERWGFRLSWDDIKAGTATLATEAFRVLTGRAAWCPQEEAERRAAICTKCFANQRGGGCWSCGFADAVRGVLATTCADARTKVDDRLQSCLVCGCLLKCKVHYPADVLKSSMSEKQKAAYADVPDCWMNTI